MRNISSPMLAFLQGAVLTMATCVQITRTDGQVFGFTDHDTDIVMNGTRYQASSGYTASAIEASNSLATSNLEIDGLLLASNGVIKRPDVEAGLWSNAAVLIFMVNYADVTMGQVNMTTGNLGQFTLANGSWKVELRGLAQTLQQSVGEQYSATCRAKFGDSRCTINTAPLTFTGTVSAVTMPGLVWSDPSLTQTGPSSPYVDTNGHAIPTASPYQVQVVAPSGSFAANTSVVDGGGRVYTLVASNPGEGQYTVNSSGLYTFASNDAGVEVFINFTYAVGYFAYGTVKWLTGQNAGYTMEVKTFAPGTVTLAMPMLFPIAAGDTYSITAGCDKQMGTCKNRWSNLINFRGEPYIPGPDVIMAPQS